MSQTVVTSVGDWLTAKGTNLHSYTIQLLHIPGAQDWLSQDGDYSLNGASPSPPQPVRLL